MSKIRAPAAFPGGFAQGRFQPHASSAMRSFLASEHLLNSLLNLA
jgi:hypothetical protein